MRILICFLIVYTLLDGTLVAAIAKALSSEVGTTVKDRISELLGSFI